MLRHANDPRAECSFTSTTEGYREVIEYTSTGVFSVTVFPLGEAVAGAVMHASMFEDMRRNYRREVLLARRLARSGFVVQRYHARGTGNSVGAPGEILWSEVLDDAADAEQRLRAHLGERQPIGLYGAGFGALVAVARAAGRRETPLAVWDPVRDSSAYSRDLRRNELIANLADGYTIERNDPTTATDRLPADLVARADDLSLAALGAAGIGRVLLSRRGHERPNAAATAAEDALRRHATSIVVRAYTDEPTSWSGAHLTERTALARWRLLDDTVAWLRREALMAAT